MSVSLRQLAASMEQTGFKCWVSPWGTNIVQSGEEVDQTAADPSEEGALVLASTSIQVLNFGAQDAVVLVLLRTDKGGRVDELSTTLNIPAGSMRDLRWSLPGIKMSGWVSVSSDMPIYPSGWFNPQQAGPIPMTFYPVSVTP
jgi:hypothetical protein